MRAVVTALSPPPAGCDSAVPAWEPVESLVWILCPVCDGACRAGSGFHCHHLYPGFPLVPLPAEAACGGAPPEQPGQRRFPRRGTSALCSSSLHRGGCSDHAAVLQQPGTTWAKQGWGGGTRVRQQLPALFHWWLAAGAEAALFVCGACVFFFLGCCTWTTAKDCSMVSLGSLLSLL